jgi:hypothetical protein
MDQEIAKAAQKLLKKQGLNFKLNTKVTAGEVTEQGIKVNVEAAKGGKAESVSCAIHNHDGPRLIISSLTPMSFSSLSVAVPTLPVWVLTTLVSRPTTVAA